MTSIDMNTQLTIFFLVDIYMFKFKYKNVRKQCEIYV